MSHITFQSDSQFNTAQLSLSSNGRLATTLALQTSFVSHVTIKYFLIFNLNKSSLDCRKKIKTYKSEDLGLKCISQKIIFICHLTFIGSCHFQLGNIEKDQPLYLESYLEGQFKHITICPPPSSE